MAQKGMEKLLKNIFWGRYTSLSHMLLHYVPQNIAYTKRFFILRNRPKFHHP